MKTHDRTAATTHLTDSEANLEAVQAGFFELFFQKQNLQAKLAATPCERIRIQLRKLRDGRLAFAVSAISRNGLKKLIAQGQASDCGQALRKWGTRLAVDFSPRDLRRILLPKKCVGLRLMPGIANGRKITLTAVGVKAGGLDITSGMGYLRSERSLVL